MGRIGHNGVVEPGGAGSTSMKWLRLYTEARTDNKLRSLTDRQFRVWFNLLCLASDQENRGMITGYDEHLLAVEVAAGDGEALRETCNALQALRSVTCVTRADGTLEITFLKFAERQYVKPSDKPEQVRNRVHKFRENKKLREQAESATGVKRDVTRCNAPETRPESESDSDSSLSQGGKPTGFVPDHPPSVKPSGSDSPEAKALVEWAGTLGVDQNQESYAEWARGSCDYAPASWVKAILRQKISGRSGMARKPVPILSKILGDFLNAGRCNLLETLPGESRGLPCPVDKPPPRPRLKKD